MKKEENRYESLEKELDAGMKDLVNSYHSIEIPPMLGEKVKTAIDIGKKEAEVIGEKDMKKYGNENNRNKSSKIFIRTGQTAAAALLAITILANSGSEVAYAMERIPLIGSITKVVTFRTYEKQEGKAEAKVEIPKIEAENGSGIKNSVEKVNKSVEDYTNQIIAQFEKDVKAENGEAHKAVFTNYEVLANNEHFFTLRINTDEIMASSAESVKIYNIDKKTDKVLELKSLFKDGTDYVTTLSDSVKEQMRKDMASDENKKYFLDDGEGSDFQKIQTEQNFYINEAGHVVLVFDEYEVAPGYMGVVEIEIPGNVYQYPGM